MNPQLSLLFAALGQQLTGLSTEVAVMAAAVNANTAELQQRRGGTGGGGSGGPGGGGGSSASARASVAATAAVNRAFTAVAAKTAAVLGPLVALNTVLGQTGSGFGVFRRSLDVLGASIAPLVLPVFVLLAAAVLAASDEIYAKLLPKLGEWYKWILSEGIPSMEKFVKWVGEAADSAIKFAEWVGENKELLKGADKYMKDVNPLNAPGHLLGGLKGLLGGDWQGEGPMADMSDWGWRIGRDLDEAIKGDKGPLGRVLGGGLKLLGLDDKTLDERGKNDPNFRDPRKVNPITNRGDGERGLFGDMVRGRMKELLKGAGPQAPGTPGGGITPGMLAGIQAAAKDAMGGVGEGAGDKGLGKGVRDYIPLITQTLRQQMGSQASMGGVSDLTNKAQMAAMQQDPLQRMIMERLLESLPKLEQALGEISGNTAPKPKQLHPGRMPGGYNVPPTDGSF